MDNLGKNYDELELSLNIKDLLMQICLKWKAMVLFAIIFAVLFNGISLMKSYRYVQVYEAENSKTAEEKAEEELEQALQDMESAKKVLSQREISEAELAKDAYDNLAVQYKNCLLYSQKSLKMKLDSGNVPTTNLYYVVDNHYQVEYPIMEKRDNLNDIIGALGEKVVNNEVIDSVVEALGGDIDAVYVRELIEVKFVSGGFIVNIVAPDSQDCQLMADVIKKSFDGIVKEVENIYGDIDVTLISETYDELFDKELMTYQIDRVNSLNNMRNQFFNTVNGLNAEQKTYYYSMLDYDVLKEGDASQQQGEFPTIEAEEKVAVNYISVKYIILGLVVGAFLVCCWVGIRYLFTSRIRVVEDLETAFGIPVFGTVKSKRRKSSSWVDKLIYTVFCGKDNFSEQDYIRMISAGVRIAAQKRKIQNLFITGTCTEEDVQKLVKELEERLKKDITTVQTGISVIVDPESLEKLSEAEAVVVVEKIGGSRYNDVKNELEKCSINCVPVLGCVVIE